MKSWESPGVSGNGQRELAETIAGLRRAESGTVNVNGRDLTNRPPAEIIAAEVAFIPEERMTMGVIRDFTVQENAILETHANAPLSRNTLFDFGAIDETCGATCARVRCQNADA